MVELNFNPGDSVRLRLAHEELDGTVLESADSSILLLKLKSGYNVGIPRENILAGRILKKFKSEDKELILPEKAKEKKNIGMILTGGTIVNKLDPRTGGVAPLTDVKEFFRAYPEMFKIVNVKKIETPFMIASESMNSEHWVKIAEVAVEMLNDPEIEGIIVTHGTDFLHYTSAALSFFLKNLNKPVVLTYSQRSSDRGSSDANLNLQCAARMAISDCAEVVLVGHASTNDDFCYALRGTKVRKLHSSRRDAFKPVNDKPIAKIFSSSTHNLARNLIPADQSRGHPPQKASPNSSLVQNKEGIEFLSEYKPRSKGKVELDTSFSDKIALVKFYPGQEPDILDYYALKYKGLVIEGSGLGHLLVEGDKSWVAKLKKYIREGLVVCVTSQCIFGRVDPFVYSNLRVLHDTGVIFLEDILSETAFVKLGWVLGHHGWKGKAEGKMLENVAGELNGRLGVDLL